MLTRIEEILVAVEMAIPELEWLVEVCVCMDLFVMLASDRDEWLLAYIAIVSPIRGLSRQQCNHC